MKKIIVLISGLVIIAFFLVYISLNIVKPKSSFPSPTPQTVNGTITSTPVAPEAEKTILDVDNFDKINYPDVYLTRQTPYSAADFSIVKSGFKETPTEHYYFTVTLKGIKDTSKIAFMDWLLSLGLTEQQIQNLDITYQ